VVLDEAQILGDAFNASFQSMPSSDESPRPLLSPILNAFRDIGGHQLTLVACGTGLQLIPFSGRRVLVLVLRTAPLPLRYAVWFAFINWQGTRLLCLKNI